MAARRRLLYVSDPSSIATNLLPDPVEEADLRGWMDTVADAGIDTFCQEVFSQGWTAYFRSSGPDCEYDQRLQHRRFLPLMAQGLTPLEILIDQARSRGLGFLAGFRVNDGHAFQAREQGLGIARFIETNPQFRLTEFPEGEFYHLAEPLDFTHPEVRTFTVDIIAEVVRRFAVDGVELCFRDHAYFPPDAGAERAPLMTDMLQQVRGVLDTSGPGRGGRRRTLGVRVFSTVEECLQLGLDVTAWVDATLVDHVSPQDAMYGDLHLPMARWAALVAGSDCALLPTLLPWTSIRARGRLDQIPQTAANARALAHTAYELGAEGLAVYNHFTTFWHAPFYPQQLFGLARLRDPERVAGDERHYVFDPTWDRFDGFGGEGRTSTGAVKAPRLHLDRSHPDVGGEYRFALYEDLTQASSATLLFRGFGLTERDELIVCLNGARVDDARIRRTRASDVTAEWDHTMSWAGRTVRSIPEQGRIDLGADGEPAFSTLWFGLDAEMVTRGENVLAVRLAAGTVPAAGTIDIDEVEVFVTPRL